MIWALAAAAHALTVRHALVIGANDGGGTLEPLRYAEADAERFASLLVELGDFDEQLVTVLFRPSEEQLRAALAQHRAIAEKYDDDLFLFYYSGHADASGLRLGDDRFWFEALKRDFGVIPAEVRLGVLDACRSGTITRLKGAQITESIFGVDGTVAEGEAWLTASSPDELAQESESLRGGFFTHYLLSGMRGAADTDDGVVDLQELYRYTFDKVVEITGRTGAGPQHPHLQEDLVLSGKLGITDVRRNASALFVLPEADWGQIAIFRLPEKTQLAEFTKASGREMAIALPPGRYLARRRANDATWETGFWMSDGARQRVENWGTPVMEVGVAKGLPDPALDGLIAESRDYQTRLKLGSSPIVAAGASAMLPGAGQLYNGQLWRGIGYFAATSTLLAGVVFEPATDDQRSGVPLVLGAAAWGASIADATYNVHRREERRPYLGVQVSTSGSWAAGGEWPRHFGVSADVMLRRGVSIGLDRVGYTAYPGGFDAQVGSRLLLAIETPKWRPYALVGFGLRYGKVTGADVHITRIIASAGGGVRYYVVPRYFLDGEVRLENVGDFFGTSAGFGMGIHLGR